MKLSNGSRTKVKFEAVNLLHGIYLSQVRARQFTHTSATSIGHHTKFSNRVQSVNCQPVTADVRVQSWAIPHGIYNKQSDSGKKSSQISSGFLSKCAPAFRTRILIPHWRYIILAIHGVVRYHRRKVQQCVRFWTSSVEIRTRSKPVNWKCSIVARISEQFYIGLHVEQESYKTS